LFCSEAISPARLAMPPLGFGRFARSASGERYGESLVLYRDFTLASTL
jgi:hypothetical protein